MHMKQNRKILCSILKTTQLGQTGIRSVMDACTGPELRRALSSQLREYDSIETEAHVAATRFGWELPELDPMVGLMAKMSGRMKVRGRNADSKIAGLVIQGNTRGMIRSLRDLHSLAGADGQVPILTQKLLDCERANIRQMQEFL